MGFDGSGEAQLDTLSGPVAFELTVAEEGLRGKLERLAALQYRLDDVGAQEAQSEDAREVGRTDAGLVAQFDNRLVPAAHEHVTELAGLAEESK